MPEESPPEPPFSTKSSAGGAKGLRRISGNSGGFPEVLGLEPHLRIKVHQEYLNAILFRDLVERHDVSHPKAVTDLASWLLDNCGGQYSINSLTGYLKSLGHSAPKAAVADYLEWFEDAFFCSPLRIFDASLARSNSNPKKVYSIDHALTRSVSSGILVNRGHQLENLVFVALRRRLPGNFLLQDTRWPRGRFRGSQSAATSGSWFRSANPWPTRRPASGSFRP